MIEGNNKPGTNKTVLSKTNQPDDDLSFKKVAPHPSLLEDDIAKRK